MIYVCEGFDAVGKDTFIEKCLGELAPNYGPTYEVFDKYLLRDDAWLIGLAIVDLLSQSNLIKSSNVLLNRWLPSSYVYARLKARDSQDEILDQEVIAKFLEIINDYTTLDGEDIFPQVTIYHVSHESKESARVIYNRSLNRPDNESFDDFNSFDDYWVRYCDAERLS